MRLTCGFYSKRRRFYNMCGIAGVVDLKGRPITNLDARLRVMARLIAHRGPDGEGFWRNANGSAGFAHRRLSIIDLSTTGDQPMAAANGTTLVQNGEIYNYIELREALAPSWSFKTQSDTETILAAYEKHGADGVNQLRGMFAFALWDERSQSLFAARDRFGIKPFYYTVVEGCFYFASEIKALLPFLPAVETDASGLAEYLTFQYTLGTHTLFKGIKQLLPGHQIEIKNGDVRVKRYWDVRYNIDHEHSERYFVRRIEELIHDSIKVHLRSDVPVASYLSGGIDSSLMAIMACEEQGGVLSGCYHGTFLDHPGYDESPYAQAVADKIGVELDILEITSSDFQDNIAKVIYALDQPVAGPGSFPQYMVSKRASEQVKVILGGQGGDEIFGGYARYLVAYFEQCIKAAIDGTYKDGSYVVTAESIIPNLQVLHEYKPMMKEFWREGLFGPLDDRYFRLIDRSTDMTDEVDWNDLDKASVQESFKTIFNNADNVGKESYFDKMTHFDFKCLLPALLQVEDRMSMAHGLESRVPLLDHSLIEFVATIPADIKFRDGEAKTLLKHTFGQKFPTALLERRDKMGFPVPLKEWYAGDLRDMIVDIFGSERAGGRPYMNSKAVLANLGKESRFSRKTWGLLSLELWYQQFHDRHWHFKALLDDTELNRPIAESALAAH